MRRIASTRARTLIIGTIGSLLAGNLAVTGFLMATRQGDGTAQPNPEASVLGERFTRETVAPLPSIPEIDDEIDDVARDSSEVADDVRGTSPVSSPDPPVAARRPRCLNSTAEVCGRFYWESETQPDKRLSVEGFYRPDRPRVGEPVTFFASASDPDARVACCSFVIDGETYGRDVERACEQRYGPWDPPRREAGSDAMSFEHVFSEEGTHVVTLVATSGDHCRHPYGGRATFTIEFVVAK